jgi:hypothetical protein
MVGLILLPAAHLAGLGSWVAPVCFRHTASYDGSAGLAAQEGRNIENLLDRIAHKRIAERIEVLRRCMARML